MPGYSFERVAEFGHGFILSAATGLLPEAREGRTQQALNIGIAFLAQFLAEHGEGIGHDILGRGGIEVGELSQADGGLAAGIGILGVETRAVVGENFGGDLIVVALEKHFYELADIAGRHAGSLAREQNTFLAGFGNLRPEHSVENVGVGIDQDAGLGHFIFLDAQDLAERVHLPAHMLHHVVDGIDLDFAALIAVEGEFNRHAFCRLHQKRGVIAVARRVLRNLRGQAFE